MRKLLIAPLAAALMLLGWSVPASAEPAPLIQITKASGEAIPGNYIVTYKEGAKAAATITSLSTAPDFVYTDALNGFAGELTADELKRLQSDPNVERIEEDGIARIAATQTNPPWGLDRIDQTNLPLSNTYTYNSTGAGVYAYIIDTGIYTSHSQFGGRAANVYNSAGGSNTDCNGHGTHVAGTVGASTYGVAKAVNLRGVKVLDCNGSGSWSGVIAGMDWVTANHTKPAVANMSLGGGYNASVNSAGTRMANAGVYTAVASGNSNANACNYSPASAANVTTVNASDSNDRKASFSNYGNCSDIWAPGVSIQSTWHNGGTNSISGTSMASPHVAGVGVLYKATYGDAASATVHNWIISNSTSGVIIGNPSGTPNRLLYKANL